MTDSCSYQRQSDNNRTSLRGDMKNVMNGVVCPRPHRLGPYIYDPIIPRSSPHWKQNYPMYQTEILDPEVATEHLDMILTKLNLNGPQGNREFIVEVLMLSLLRHSNLVTLIGYCIDEDQRLLVYEYMPRGSLENHLFEQATKDLLKEFLVKFGKVVDTEKENKRLGMIHHESARAIVKDYDLPIEPQEYTQCIMPMYHEKWVQAKALPGVNRLMKHLHKHGIPFALASNSIKKNVEVKLSSQKGWKDYFSVILGSDEVKSGKPSPDLFLEAAKRMGVDASCCLVIEDSVVGIKAGKAANMQVVAVPSIQTESDDFSIADYILHSFLDFQPQLWGLPPFHDWVMKALPIEPLCLKGSYKNGFFQEISDNGVLDLPGQVWGVYFGWAETESHHRFKIVVGIKWDRSHGTFTRNIHACIINGRDEEICDQKMQVTLVGYIRGFLTKESLSIDGQIRDEDKSIAEACLDVVPCTN